MPSGSSSTGRCWVAVVEVGVHGRRTAAAAAWKITAVASAAGFEWGHSSMQ